MVNGGRHATANSGLGRSAGSAALRGAVLLAVAVVLGIVLLQRANREPFASVRAGTSKSTESTPTTLRPATTTTSVALRAPAQVKVLAANGTGVAGLAGRAKDKLAAAGYNALAPVDATNPSIAASVVYYAPGYQGEAAAIGKLVAISSIQPLASQPPVSDLAGANVLVVLGKDQASTATTTG